MKAEWSNKDSLEMPTTTSGDYIKREDVIQLINLGIEVGDKYLLDNDYEKRIKAELIQDTLRETITRINNIPPADVIVLGNEYKVGDYTRLYARREGVDYFQIVRGKDGIVSQFDKEYCDAHGYGDLDPFGGEDDECE